MRNWIYVIVWMGIMLLVSSIPGWFAEPIQREMSCSVFSMMVSEPMVHFTEYSVLGCLLYNALRDTCPKRSLDSLLLMVLGIVMTFAFLDEAYQFFIPERGFETFDLLVDFMGVTSVCGYVNMKMPGVP